MATYSANPPDMAISTWGGGTFSYKHDSAQDPSDGSKSRFYELYQSGSLVGTGQYGIEIRYENSQNVIYANTGNPTNSDTPTYFTSNNDVSVVLGAGATTVSIYNSGGNVEGSFVVAADNLWVPIGTQSTGGSSTQSTGSSSTQKKVFCNFW